MKKGFSKLVKSDGKFNWKYIIFYNIWCCLLWNNCIIDYSSFKLAF